MMMAPAGVRKAHDPEARQHPENQRQGQRQAVMGMELQFRQKVGAGDAKEGAGAKGQGGAQPGGVRLGP
jgi:hypothetical protein